MVIMTACSLHALAQNAPGNLPWGAAPDGAPSVSVPKAYEGGNRITSFLTGELFRHANGSAWFGFDSSASESERFNTLDTGFGLNSSGFILDPRLWSQVMSINLDRVGSSGGASHSLGFFLNGSLLQKRSFPLRVTVIRRVADGNSLDFEDHSTYHATTLDWSLRKANLPQIGLTATFAGTEQDQSFNALPTLGSTLESERNLDGNISRTFWGWVVTGNAFDYHIRSISNGFSQLMAFEEISKGGGVAVHRSMRLGQNGDLNLSLIRHSQHISGVNNGFSAFALPATGISFTSARALLSYNHTEKLRGSYSADYTSNISQQAIANGITSLSPGQLNPGLLQALSSPQGSSSLSTNANWNYRMTSRWTLGAGAGHTLLEIPSSLAATQSELLPSFQPVTAYTALNGMVNYIRPIGKWETNWHVNLTRNLDQVRDGSGFAEDSRSVGLGVARTIDRWRWTSDFSYSEYLPGRQGLFGRNEERWSNKLQTHFGDRKILDLDAELVHTDSNVNNPASLLLLQSQRSATTLLLMQAALSSRRWDVTGGTGLRYLDTRNLSEISNPLLVPATTTADHFADLFVAFKVRRALNLHGGYRRDSLTVSGGETDRFSGMEFGFAYQLRRLTVEGGYERQDQEQAGHRFDRNRFYVRIRRPFRLY